MESLMTNLVINEEKSIKNTFIYIRNLKINEESYEAKILSEDNIENIIKYQIVYEGENRVLKYDVSNSMSLDECIKIKSLTKDDICRIMLAIDEVLMSIENYLLSESSIALDFRLIRVVKKKESKLKYKFIAIPNFNSSFSFELSKFLVRLLRHIDVEDKEALSLAYGLFVRSSKDNYTINDLMELVDKVYDKKSFVAEYISEDELNKYDEEMANEISEEIMEENKTLVLDDMIESNNVLESVTINNDKEGGLVIDSETKAVLGDSILNDFGSEDKKIIAKEKKPGLFSGKRALKGNISIGIIGYILAPILIIVAPLLYYFILA